MRGWRMQIAGAGWRGINNFLQRHMTMGRRDQDQPRGDPSANNPRSPMPSITMRSPSNNPLPTRLPIPRAVDAVDRPRPVQVGGRSPSLSASRLHSPSIPP